MAVSGMRGLSVFISDIRNCQNKEQERIRVDKELANIRNKFKSDKALTPYDKKKYVWKMLYIYMLGYDVDFGHLEAVNLISNPKYAEKQVGYIVTSCLLNENHDFLRLVINSVRNDIIGRNETAQCLALTMVGNVGGKEFAESLTPDVQKLLVSGGIRPVVRKKAALCLLRLFRKNPEVVNVEGWSEKMAGLLEEKNLGVLTAVMSLLVALVSTNPEGYTTCIPKCVQILEMLIQNKNVPQEYTYYGLPTPWLQVKTMRVLQYFPSIDDQSLRTSLFDVLQRILAGTDVVKNVNKNNAAHAVLFEALALVMHLDAEPRLMLQCVSLLGKFITVREPNIRYLGLENMARILRVADVQDSIRKHQPHVLSSLRDPDISIRRRTLDLLYGMCDVNNAKEIVEELLQYLTTADFIIREELALKAAILAEKFSPDLSWYVDVILQLIEKAGNFISDDMWHRVVQFVTNNEELQAYAAAKVRDYIAKPAVHENMVKAAGYILGEYSHLLSNQPGCSPIEIFTLLHDKFPTASVPTKALLLTGYIKILLRVQPVDPQLLHSILSVFHKYANHLDAEVQQRAVEYIALSARGPSVVDIVAEMPRFPDRESLLEKKAEEAENDTSEVSAEKLRSQNMSQAIVLVKDPSVATLPDLKLPQATAEEDTITILSDLPVENGGDLHVEDSSDSLVDTAADTLALAVVPAVQPDDILSQLMSLEAPSAPAPVPAPAPATPQETDAFTQQKNASLAPSINVQPALAAEPPVETNGLALAMYEAPSSGVQPLGSVAEWFQALVTKDSGVLYEDPFVQIGVKSEWNGPHGRVILFIGNKDTGPLSACTGQVAPTAGIRAKAGLVPPVIPPRAQIQIPVDIAAVQIPREVPTLDFSYSTATNRTVPLQLYLPVVLSKFLSPVSVAPNDFFSRWKALSGPPLKLQEVVKGVRPLPLPLLAAFLASLHIAVAPDLDPNPNNLVAATVAHTETAPPLLILLRIETDPADRTQLRLTVGSQDPAGTQGVKDFVQSQLVDSSSTAPLPGFSGPFNPPVAASLAQPQVQQRRWD